MKQWILIFLVLLAAFILAACSNQVNTETIKRETQHGNTSYNQISVEELQTILKDKDFLQINVHIPFAGDIPNTDLSIPYNQIEENINQLPSDKNTKFVVYCRSGNMSRQAASTLAEMGYEVLGVDNDEEIVNDLKDKITQAVQADITEERVLKELGVKNFDAAIVCIGTDLETSILVTMMLKEMGVKYIIAKAQNNLHAKILEKIGVDKAVFPERDMGARIARRLITPNIKDYIELEPDYNIIEIKALSKFVDKTLSELDLRNKYGINVLAIKRNDSFNISPRAKDVIKKEDFLIVIGETKKINELAAKANH